MKTTLYILAVVLFLPFISCKSVEKLVDQGRYDEAIVLATKKLAGKNNKKTKHIKALEKAFFKVNKKNLEDIARLKARGNGENWSKIYDYGQRIHLRQSRILPFLPLVSKDGYVGDFEILDVEPLLAEAGKKMSDFLYEQGNILLAQARRNDNKVIAQKAYYEFREIGKYLDEYKDVRQLMNESKKLGTFHVLLRIDNALPDYTLSSDWVHHRLRNEWDNYYTEHSDGIAFDAISTLFLEQMDISPEREVINNLQENKELERWVDARDKDGNTVKDTLGNVIQVKEIEYLSARVTEIVRSKSAVAYGRVETINYVSGDLIDEDSFTHEIYFNSEACRFEGDKRALSENIRKRTNNTLLPFPTDYDMMAEGFSKMEENFMGHVDRLDLSRYFERSMASY